MAGIGFKEWMLLRADLQREVALDLSETNVYGLRDWGATGSGSGVDESRGRYRCHVAEDYLGVLKLEAELPKVCVATGVRVILEEVMRDCKERGLVVGLPMDVYPWYLKKAREVGVKWVEYSQETLERGGAVLEADVVLVCFPVRPWATSKAEILSWLKWWISTTGEAGRLREVVIDGVYDGEAVYGSDLGIGCSLKEEAVANGWTWIHSLSKAWLMPGRVGMGVLSEGMLGVRARVAMLPKEAAMLLEGWRVLTTEGVMGARQVADLMCQNKAVVVERLRSVGVSVFRGEGLEDAELSWGMEDLRYLGVAMSWQWWFDRGVLVIPESVFRGDGSSQGKTNWKQERGVLSTVGRWLG